MSNLIFDFLFPKRCVSCNKFGFYICSKCRRQLIFISQNICPVCQRPSIDGQTHPGCSGQYCLDGLFSAFLYRPPIKKALHLFKYRPFLSDLASELVKLTKKSLKSNQDNFITQFIKIERPIIAPIPIFSKKQKTRGFNQSEILGRLLAKEFRLAFSPDLFLRIKETKPQAKLKLEERKKNIKAAFVLNPEFSRLKISKNNLLLIDDIWATGTTLKTCANLAKRKGFKKVWGLTIAR